MSTALCFPIKTNILPAATEEAPPSITALLKCSNVDAPPEATIGILISLETFLIRSKS